MKLNLTRAADVSPNPQGTGARASLYTYSLTPRGEKTVSFPGVLQLGISSWATDKQASGRQISQGSSKAPGVSGGAPGQEAVSSCDWLATRTKTGKEPWLRCGSALVRLCI